MKSKLIAFVIVIIGVSQCFRVSAQIDVEEKSKDAVENRADQRTSEGIDKGLDAVEDGVKSLFKKKEKKPKQEAAKTESDSENKENNKEVSSKTEVKQEPTLAIYSKFDFVPGDKIFFYEDFAQDALADFPALWNTNGSGEVTNNNLYPGKWFKMNAGGYFMPEITIPFNENFTFECDLIFKDAPESNSTEGLYIYLIAASAEWKVGDNFNDGCEIGISKGTGAGVSWKDGNEFFRSVDQPYAMESMTTKLRVSVWVQKQRMRLYINEAKVLDLPRLLPPGLTYNKLEFLSTSYEGHNSLMTNVRIAYGAPDTRNKLMKEGKLVTHGILFDVNSDKVKAESYGTLKEIAQVLTENPTVKVKIIGHTDGDGDAAKNLDLSKRRAASVKSELAKTFGIDASRIETDGKGKSEPIAPNDTPINKAQNRRVEFIKL